MAVAGRRYEVRGISKKGGKLKATVKGIDPKKRMHVDTVDFYSARSRTFLLKGLADLFGADEATVTQDLAKLTEQAEQNSGWSDFQVRTHIRQLEDLEYIYSLMGKRGKEYVYELAYNGKGEDGKPFIIGLTDIKQLKEKAKEAGITDDNEGKNRNYEHEGVNYEGGSSPYQGH